MIGDGPIYLAWHRHTRKLPMTGGNKCLVPSKPGCNQARTGITFKDRQVVKEKTSNLKTRSPSFLSISMQDNSVRRAW